jgi:hypothetical protein
VIGTTTIHVLLFGLVVFTAYFPPNRINSINPLDERQTSYAWGDNTAIIVLPSISQSMKAFFE